MLGRIAVQFTIALLKMSRLSNGDKQLLTTALLDKLKALPIRGTIRVDETGTVFVGGRQLTVESARRLHETSKVMLTNYARKFVREQVTFMAIRKGVHENTTPEEGLFAKAALWCFQEEDALYRELAQTAVEEE